MTFSAARIAAAVVLIVAVTLAGLHLKPRDSGASSHVVYTEVPVVSGNYHFGSSDVSGDGRYVVFESQAMNLVAGDTNGVSDVFVYDRVTGTTTRLSRTAQGGQLSDPSHDPRISWDGKRAFFVSIATDATLTIVSLVGSPSVLRTISLPSHISGWMNRGIDITPDGKTLVHGNRLYNTDSGAWAELLENAPSETFARCISASGRYVVVDSRDAGPLRTYLVDLEQDSVRNLSLSYAGSLLADDTNASSSNCVSDQGLVGFESQAFNVTPETVPGRITQYLYDVEADSVRIVDDNCSQSLAGSLTDDGGEVLYLCSGSMYALALSDSAKIAIGHVGWPHLVTQDAGFIVSQAASKMGVRLFIRDELVEPELFSVVVAGITKN